MTNSKTQSISTITLLPIGNEEFYAAIIPEESKRGKFNNLWIFRKGCGIAQYYSGSMASYEDSKMTPDGIRALDAIGQYDDVKELLIESE